MKGIAMNKCTPEFDRKTSDFMEAVRHEYYENTGKELPIEKFIQIAIDGMRKQCEEVGMDIFVKAVDRSGILDGKN